MDILLPGLAPHLAKWDARAFAPGVADGARPGDQVDVYTRVVATEAPGPPAPDGPFQRVAAAIARYEIFPPCVVTGVLHREPLAPGDTVGICYRRLRLVRLFFAARVVATFAGRATDDWRTGFTYRTLVGHPELGEESFAVEKDATGAVRVSLSSWSRPGTLLARLFAPIVRRLQVHGSHAALDHLAAVARGGPAAAPKPTVPLTPPRPRATPPRA